MAVGAQLRANLNAQRIGSGSVTFSYSWQFTAPQTGSDWVHGIGLGVTFPDGSTSILFSSDSPSNRSSGSRTHRSTQVGVHTYTFVALAIDDNGAGTLVDAQSSVNVEWLAPPPRPTASISASDTSPLFRERITISWSSSNATSVSITADRIEFNNTSFSGSSTFSRDEASVTFAITATGPGGTATDSVTVTWALPPPNAPTASITASDTSPNAGQSVDINWSSSNATAVSVTANDNLTNVGIQISTSLFGTRTYRYTFRSTITFIITATGPGGTATDSVTVRWPAPLVPLPTASIAASNTRPASGQSVIISWVSSNAPLVSVTANGNPISATLSGSVNYTRNIATSITFEITATGPGGTDTDSVTVTWAPPIIIPPVVTATDSSWSSLVRADPLTPTPSTDSEWSSLEPAAPYITVDRTTSIVSVKIFDPGPIYIEVGDTRVVNFTHLIESSRVLGSPSQSEIQDYSWTYSFGGNHASITRSGEALTLAGNTAGEETLIISATQIVRLAIEEDDRIRNFSQSDTERIRVIVANCVDDPAAVQWPNTDPTYHLGNTNTAVVLNLDPWVINDDKQTLRYVQPSNTGFAPIGSSTWAIENDDEPSDGRPYSNANGRAIYRDRSREIPFARNPSTVRRGFHILDMAQRVIANQSVNLVFWDNEYSDNVRRNIQPVFRSPLSGHQSVAVGGTWSFNPVDTITAPTFTLSNPRTDFIYEHNHRISVRRSGNVLTVTGVDDGVGLLTVTPVIHGATTPLNITSAVNRVGVTQQLFFRVGNAPNYLTTIQCPDPTTDSAWSRLVASDPHVEPSTDSEWSDLSDADLLDSPTTDSNWSLLIRANSYVELATDSAWSDLVNADRYIAPSITTDSAWSDTGSC